MPNDTHPAMPTPTAADAQRAVEAAARDLIAALRYCGDRVTAERIERGEFGTAAANAGVLWMAVEAAHMAGTLSRKGKTERALAHAEYVRRFCAPLIAEAARNDASREGT